MIRKVYWLGLLVFLFTTFSGCSLDDGGTQISFDVPVDGSLFENEPEDTVLFKINTHNSHFRKTFTCERREVQLDNPVEGNYTDLFTYERKAASCAEVRITLKIDDEWKTLSTNRLQQAGFLLDLEQAELLDEFSVYARLKSTFTTDVVQVIPESANPLKVHISGSFIINIKA